ncbi:MAG: class I SAM-dependent methyltransferase [Chloroflexota bacterium]|nr:class I SAM-dependent methyltransferase [Chloroflexota bacterium]MDE2918980.1 class I SAM-dependent methyltransferase [Chloroflexota bacterium]
MRSSDSSTTRSEVWADRAAEREANLANWNDRVAAHLASPGYDVEGFIADPSRIGKAVELDREEIGDVRGLSLLHLQCHIGLDTLSWARLGAQVTGLDFSPPAIEAAREISRRTQTPAEFVLADVYEAPEALDKAYDMVYASEGVLCWLPDVAAWARVLRCLTRPGGTAYIRDGHPIFHALDHDRLDGRLELVGSYFEGAAHRYDEPGTYVESCVQIEHTVNYEWDHGLGEIVNGFIQAGFRIESLREYGVSAYQALPGMIKGQDDWWRLPRDSGQAPSMFSLRATLPE